MPKMGKKQRRAIKEALIQKATVGLQIPLLAIPAIYRNGEALLEPGVCATGEEFVQRFQEFAIEKGAVKV